MEIKKKYNLIEFINLIRVYQWLKNILIFLPLFTVNIFPDTNLILKYFFGFFALSLCASSVYVFNDILDFKNDKSHPIKCQRPIASEQFSIYQGLIFGFVILIIGLILSYNINLKFFLHILSYIVITNLYSVFFKKLFLLDCIFLSFFYTFRIIIGCSVMEINISHWLFVISFFWFLSLAIIKRYSELLIFKTNNKKKLLGRNYYVKDIDKVKLFGLISGYISLIFLSFYIYSNNAKLYFTQPNIIWFLVLILFIWINYMWFNAAKNKIFNDPVIYALKNKTSLFLGFIFILFSMLAKWI